jgi:hypothetical protein
VSAEVLLPPDDALPLAHQEFFEPAEQVREAGFGGQAIRGPEDAKAEVRFGTNRLLPEDFGA